MTTIINDIASALPTLPLLGLAIVWFAPDWGRKWLAFGRDWRDFRSSRPRKQRGRSDRA